MGGGINLNQSTSSNRQLPKEVKSPENWTEIEDFKAYCYNNFVFINNGQLGDILVCQDKKNKGVSELPLFYLFWKQDKTFIPIEKIDVKETSGDFTISFTSFEAGTSSKQIIVKRGNNNGLKGLSNKELTKICKIETDTNQLNYLNCSKEGIEQAKRYSYKVLLKEFKGI